MEREGEARAQIFWYIFAICIFGLFLHKCKCFELSTVFKFLASGRLLPCAREQAFYLLEPSQYLFWFPSWSALRIWKYFTRPHCGTLFGVNSPSEINSNQLQVATTQVNIKAGMLQEGIQVERQGGCPVLFVDVLKWTPSCNEIWLKIHVAIGTQSHR